MENWPVYRWILAVYYQKDIPRVALPWTEWKRHARDYCNLFFHVFLNICVYLIMIYHLSTENIMFYPYFFSGFYSIGGRKIYALRSPSDARTTIYFASGELRQRAPSAEWFGMGWKVWSLSSLYFRMGFGGWIWTKYHVHLNTEVISCAYINNIK